MNDLVRDGYDRIAETYLAQRDLFSTQRYMERFLELLESDSTVLDLGCGSGVPASQLLVKRGLDVLGLDISPRQVALAQSLVPQGRFEVADMLTLTAGQLSVGGVVSLYAIFHTGREHHAKLFQTLHSFLPRGGPLLVTMGGSEWEGKESDFHGAEMFWSHFGPQRNREIVEAAGFQIVVDEIDESGGERHQVILATA